MEEEVGKVFKYFRKPSVAAIKIENGEVEVGDTLRFEGDHTDFEQEVESMEIDGEEVEKIGPGDEVGIKVEERVRKNDKVFRKD
ncbi:MAG: translation elongation factor-like protein [Candidatus Thermoplasmatota archaeon]|nr:translation elongation factor-like protein [Candidatus Thermoplasmatota archaeon]